MGLGPIAFILSLLAQDVWSMRQASNATGGCDSLFGRKCCSSRCNGIRDGSQKDSGVENLELYECIVTEGASGKPMPSYGAYDWDEKPVTSKQLNDWIAGYRGYRTAGIEYSDYVCQETCRYVTKGEPKDPSPGDGRDKVKVYRAGGVEPERGELALCVSKGEKQSSDKEEKMRDGLDAIRQAQQDWEARRTVTEPIEQEKEQEKALAEEEEGNKNLEDRSKVVEQKPIRVPYLPNNEDHVDDDEIEDVLPLVGDDYGNKLLPWVEDHIIDERFLVGEDRPSDNALDILNMVGKHMYLQQEKKWKGLSEAEKKAKRQEEKDQAIADYLASAKGQEEVAEQKNPKVSRKQKLKSKLAAARAKIFGK